MIKEDEQHFTFQSGSILMLLHELGVQYSQSFTFQSGSILMDTGKWIR